MGFSFPAYRHFITKPLSWFINRTIFLHVLWVSPLFVSLVPSISCRNRWRNWSWKRKSEDEREVRRFNVTSFVHVNLPLSITRKAFWIMINVFEGRCACRVTRFLLTLSVCYQIYCHNVSWSLQLYHKKHRIMINVFPSWHNSWPSPPSIKAGRQKQICKIAFFARLPAKGQNICSNLCKRLQTEKICNCCNTHKHVAPCSRLVEIWKRTSRLKASENKQQQNAQTDRTLFSSISVEVENRCR